MAQEIASSFTAADRKAGYGYDISILQTEFSLTQVFDEPAHGRQFCKQVIRKTLDLARPEHVELTSTDASSPGCDAVPASLLQEYPHQAVSQGKPSFTHRDHGR
jgi:hypothetical protein